MLKVYTDAATKGNPGVSGAGVMITGEDIYIQLYYPLPIMTNHQAEFAAVCCALAYLIDHQMNQKTILLYTDSKIVSQSIAKNYINNNDFDLYFKKIKEYEATFSSLIVQWIPEKQNKGADHLARQGLQVAIKQNNRQ